MCCSTGHAGISTPERNSSLTQHSLLHFEPNCTRRDCCFELLLQLSCKRSSVLSVCACTVTAASIKIENAQGANTNAADRQTGMTACLEGKAGMLQADYIVKARVMSKAVVLKILDSDVADKSKIA